MHFMQVKALYRYGKAREKKRFFASYAGGSLSQAMRGIFPRRDRSAKNAEGRCAYIRMKAFLCDTGVQDTRYVKVA